MAAMGLVNKYFYAADYGNMPSRKAADLASAALPSRLSGTSPAPAGWAAPLHFSDFKSTKTLASVVYYDCRLQEGLWDKTHSLGLEESEAASKPKLLVLSDSRVEHDCYHAPPPRPPTPR